MKEVICLEYARCHKRKTCPHAVPHQEMGIECWPTPDRCPGCFAGAEQPPEWRQKKSRKLKLHEASDYSVMRDWGGVVRGKTNE